MEIVEGCGVDGGRTPRRATGCCAAARAASGAGRRQRRRRLGGTARGPGRRRRSRSAMQGLDDDRHRARCAPLLDPGRQRRRARAVVQAVGPGHAGDRRRPAGLGRPRPRSAAASISPTWPRARAPRPTSFRWCGDVRIARSWAGIEAKTRDLLPVIGPSPNAPGVVPRLRLLRPRLPARAGRRRDRLRPRRRMAGPSVRSRPSRRGRLIAGKGRGMTGYIIRRLLLAIPTLFVMLTAIFVLVRLVPGDAGIGDPRRPGHRPPRCAALRSKLGLDQPRARPVPRLPRRRADRRSRPVAQQRRSSVSRRCCSCCPHDRADAVPRSRSALVFGVPLGVAAALSRNGWVDYRLAHRLAASACRFRPSSPASCC